jgi:hypothetical protein
MVRSAFGSCAPSMVLITAATFSEYNASESIFSPNIFTATSRTKFWAM